MTPDEPKDDTAEYRRQTFRSFELDDYFDRRRRTDHAPNAALHASLRALAESDESPIANVNLTASHGPALNDQRGEPRYEVRVDIENHGAGSAHTGPTILKQLIQYDDVTVVWAESMSIVPESDNYEGGGDYPTDRLTVGLNPVQTQTRPVEVPYSAVPDDFAKVDTLRNDAGKVLGLVANDGATRDEFFTVADALATLIKVNAPDSDYEDVDPDAAAGVERDGLVYERSDVDVDALPDGDRHGVDVAGLVDSLEDLADEYDKAGKNAGEDRGEPWRRAASDIRVALDDHAKDSEDDTHFEDTTVACGCGDYSVKVPEGSAPQAIDAVCPECGNHFGHGPAPGDACPCRHDHEDDPMFVEEERRDDVVDPVESYDALRRRLAEWVDDHRDIFDTPGTIDNSDVRPIADDLAEAVAGAVPDTPRHDDEPDDVTAEDIEELRDEVDDLIRDIRSGDFGGVR